VAIKAIVEAEAKHEPPAQPKGKPDVGKPASVPQWPNTDSEDYQRVELFLYNGFGESMDDVAVKLGKKWSDFKSADTAIGAIRNAAFHGEWSMLATKAEYITFGKDKKPAIRFSTVNPMVWWKGRENLQKSMVVLGGEATANWEPVKSWEVGNTYDLPEEIWVHVQKSEDGKQLIIKGVESAVAQTEQEGVS
jgi:hypothetical protein